MRNRLIGLLALASAGCLTAQPSLFPLFTPAESLVLSGIAGTWVSEGDDPMILTLRPLEGSVYEMTLREDGKARQGTFAVLFGRLKGDLYWDLTARRLENEQDLWTEHRLPLHSFARVRWDEDRLEISLLDAGKVNDALREGRLEVPHAELETDRDLVLTAPTGELQRFLAEHAQRDDLLGDPAVFHRGAVD